MGFCAHPLENATKFNSHKTLLFGDSSVTLYYKGMYEKPACLLKGLSAEINANTLNHHN